MGTVLGVPILRATVYWGLYMDPPVSEKVLVLGHTLTSPVELTLNRSLFFGLDGHAKV